MTKPGYIEITDKVYFVYHELRKPNKADYFHYEINNAFIKTKYDYDLRAYEASKRSVEVSNVKKAETTWFYKYRCGYIKLAGKMVINNQSCKAEITDNEATIIEIESSTPIILMDLKTHKRQI